MLTNQEQTSANFYKLFSNKAKVFYCAICCTLLYFDEIKTRQPPSDINAIPCVEWGFPPIFTSSNNVIVCKLHQPIHKPWSCPIQFPGHQPQAVTKLSYHELSCLSPIKIMSRLTRGVSKKAVNLGHFQALGDIWMDYNYLFSGFILNGSLGLFYNDQDINSTYIYIHISLLTYI